ncbi:hypothetical protein [Streptomyces sp. NPDC046979]|uniref:hypothetical protein n=1 Tax=Streptomyces sp. NPDC046979 TaxID=3154604 RepID=UPI0033D3C6E3
MGAWQRRVQEGSSGAPQTDGKATPSKRSLAQLETVYVPVRRQNVARYLGSDYGAYEYVMNIGFAA